MRERAFAFQTALAYLWRAIPQRHNLMRVRLDRHGKCSPQPQVCNLEGRAGPVHQQVLRLEVPMHNTVAVQVSNPFAHLHNDEKSHARTHTHTHTKDMYAGLSPGVGALARTW